MRTHSDIVRSIARLDKFAQQRGVSLHTARSWIQRDRIPAEHWKAVAEASVASLEELAEAAAARCTKPLLAEPEYRNGFRLMPRGPNPQPVTMEIINAIRDEFE